MRTKVNIWRLFEEYPPILVRLLARSPRGGPTITNDLAVRSPLFPYEIEAISSQTSWDGVPVPKAIAYLKACGVDFSDCRQMRRIRQRLIREPKTPGGRFAYLKRSPHWESYFKPLLQRYVAHIKASKAA